MRHLTQLAHNLRRGPGLLMFVGALLGCMLVLPSVDAHTIRPAVVSMVIAEDGVTEIEIRANAETWLADISADYSDTNDSPNAALYDELRALSGPELQAAFDDYVPELLSRLRLEADGERVPLEFVGIKVADEPDIELARDSWVTLSADIPAGAEGLIWFWPDEYGSNVLRIRRGDSEDTFSVWLKRGEVNDSYPLSTAPAERSRLVVAADYVVIGFEHIVPKGLDHILFVLGIFLLSTRLGPLLWQVTAFTLAHTLTLGLSIYGLISAPSSFVEPLIALSIAYVGIENCLSSKLHSWRIVLVFCFGLLHGMGFAGVLSEIGLPPSEFLTALITFNVGVEFGQLTVILCAFVLIGWWRSAPWYRVRIVIPLSALISVVGLYWTWERIFG